MLVSVTKSFTNQHQFMIEVENVADKFEHIHISDDIAKLYFDRMTNALCALEAISKSDFIIHYWEEIPIYPENGMRGLKYGLVDCVSKCYSALNERGYGLEARAVLEFDRRKKDANTRE